MLTAIDEPGRRDDAVPPPGRLGDSGLFYDALELTHDSSKEYRSDEIEAEVVPTIFYKERAAKLFEIIEVCVHFGERPVQGTVSLTVGNFSSTQEFKPDRDFGATKAGV